MPSRNAVPVHDLPRHSDLLVAAGDQEELRASRAPMNARRLRKLLGFWNGQKTNLGFGQFPPGRLLLPGASLDVGRSASLAQPSQLRLNFCRTEGCALVRGLRCNKTFSQIRVVKTYPPMQPVKDLAFCCQ